MFYTIYLLGAAQGLLLVFVLAFRKNNVESNRVLALLLGLFSFNLLSLALREYGFSGVVFITAPFSFLYGPLLWLYVSLLTRRIDNKINSLFVLHFLPYLFAIYLHSPLSLFDVSSLRILLLGFKIIQYAGYLTFSLVVLKKHETFIRDFFSEVGRLTLKWLKIMILIDYLSLVIVAVIFVLHVFGLYDVTQSFTVSRVTFILSSVSIYIIGYFSMQQSDISYSELKNDLSGEQSPASLGSNRLESLNKYEKSRIEEELLLQYKEMLTKYMETEKPYVDPDLTLQQLADSLSLSYHILSQVINAGFNQNFYNYINTYRINEATKMLEDPDRKDEKILSIAYEAGFKNKSNFNTFFKKITKLTPSEYKRLKTS